MKKQVLFIQGGGDGAYEVDSKLAASLQESLGAAYDVHYPEMPDEHSPDYIAWKNTIVKEYAALGNQTVLVGHSLGASMLLKYVLEANIQTVGLFLIATPCWNADDWEVADYALPEIFTPPKASKMFLYHSRNDEIVPFEHMAIIGKKLPDAMIREFDGRDHQFNNDLSEVARDIKRLFA